MRASCPRPRTRPPRGTSAATRQPLHQTQTLGPAARPPCATRPPKQGSATPDMKSTALHQMIYSNSGHRDAEMPLLTQLASRHLHNHSSRKRPCNAPLGSQRARGMVGALLGRPARQIWLVSRAEAHVRVARCLDIPLSSVAMCACHDYVLFCPETFVGGISPVCSAATHCTPAVPEAQAFAFGGA